MSSRWYFLVPFLALRVLGGCGSSDGDVQPTVSTGVELTLIQQGETPCGQAGWLPTGMPANIVVRAALVTESCRCKYTAVGNWSFSTAKQCESEYDLGGENPIECNALDSEAVTIENASASTSRDDCVADVTFDAGSASVTVQCSAEGYVSVNVVLLTNKGTGQSNHTMLFMKPETACPAATAADGGADAAAADAGVRPDASDGAPPGDAQALDAEDPDAQDR